jgi:hypothetical protein
MDQGTPGDRCRLFSLASLETVEYKTWYGQCLFHLKAAGQKQRCRLACPVQIFSPFAELGSRAALKIICPKDNFRSTARKSGQPSGSGAKSDQENSR